MFLIEMCESNDMMQYLDQLEEDGCEVVTYYCLDRCGECLQNAYVYAESQLVEHEHPAELLHMLRLLKQDADKQMEQWLEDSP